VVGNPDKFLLGVLDRAVCGRYSRRSDAAVRHCDSFANNMDTRGEDMTDHQLPRADARALKAAKLVLL
jgi:hypothetical protein